jgi:hypothetical protein
MELKDYELRLKEINERFEKEKRELAKDYAFANNPYKIGDIISDSVGSIKVDLIQHTIGGTFIGKYPQCVYSGIELKKDLTPKKNGDRRKVFQSSIIKN